MPEAPLTPKQLLRWGTAIAGIISAVVGVVLFAASIKSDLISLRDEMTATKREMVMKDDQHTKDIDKLKDRADNTDKAVADLNRKLDVAVAILERIDKKVSAN